MGSRGFPHDRIAQQKLVSCKDVARKWAVLVTYNEGYLWRSQVSHSCSNTPGSTLDVEVKARAFQAQCPWHYKEEYGQSCFHCMALTIFAKIGPNDKQWYHSVYHTSTYQLMHKLQILSILLLGKLAFWSALATRTQGQRRKTQKNRHESTSDGMHSGWAYTAHL
jgi:hypothetical protein